MQKDLGTGYTIEEFDDSDVCTFSLEIGKKKGNKN